MDDDEDVPVRVDCAQNTEIRHGNDAAEIDHIHSDLTLLFHRHGKLCTATSQYENVSNVLKQHQFRNVDMFIFTISTEVCNSMYLHIQQNT